MILNDRFVVFNANCNRLSHTSCLLSQTFFSATTCPEQILLNSSITDWHGKYNLRKMEEEDKNPLLKSLKL